MLGFHYNNNSGIISKYSINLMWINKPEHTNKTFIAPYNDKDLKFKLLDPVIKWAEANPNASINLWYDSAYTTEEAIKNTQNILQGIAKEKKIANIKLKDIRKISVVKDNPNVFSKQLPIYFRIDLLKLIIIVDEIENGQQDSAIFADLDVSTELKNGSLMTKNTLFDPMIMRQLNECGGLLLGRADDDFCCDPDIQFIQLINNPDMIYAIKLAIINVNLERAMLALKCENPIAKKMLLANLVERVCFDTMYKLMVFYKDVIIEDPNNKDLKIFKEGSWVPYKPVEHGYWPFGLATTVGSKPYIPDTSEQANQAQWLKLNEKMSEFEAMNKDADQQKYSEKVSQSVSYHPYLKASKEVYDRRSQSFNDHMNMKPGSRPVNASTPNGHSVLFYQIPNDDQYLNKRQKLVTTP